MPGLLSSLLGGSPSQDKQTRPGPFDDFWYEVTRLTATGLRLGLREAMTVPAFRRCVAVLAGSIASLPLIIYRRTDDGKERAPEHPLYPCSWCPPSTCECSLRWSWSPLIEG